MSKTFTLLIVSGNTFPDEPWGLHTASQWREFGNTFDQVHIFARSTGQKWVRTSNGSVTVHLIPRGPTPMATFILSSWLVPLVLYRTRPSVIQAQSPVHGGLACAVLGRLLGIPVLIEMHGEHYLRDRPKGHLAHRLLYKPLTSLALKWCSRIRSLSEEMTGAIGQVYGPRALAKVVELPNRVDLDVFSPAKSDYAWHDPVSVVTVGSLVPNKNHVGLLHALAAWPRRVTLCVVGSGPERQAILDTADALGVDVCVTGTLSPPEVASRLRTADVYVHFSRSEAVSRAVLEAMASGLPVIVTPVGFMKGILKHGITGLILDERAASLSEAMCALSEQAARERLGRAARQHIERNHEWNRAFATHCAMLLDMVESGA